MKFLDTDDQWVDIFNKPLSDDHSVCIWKHLNMVGLSN